MRFDVIADTHGFLSDELLGQLKGTDMIVHAGDVCSGSDYRTLERIAPLRICLGNSDFAYDYGPEIKRDLRFFSAGLRWQVQHYRERLDLMVCDVAVCGHTHRPYIETTTRGVLVINPGSPTYPRGGEGPTMARVVAEDGKILSAEIIQLG